tara:strand:+ start:6623 stop:7720 length:1098 start_codon:yes stop_codon:yes gene_type:complete
MRSLVVDLSNQIDFFYPTKNQYTIREHISNMRDRVSMFIANCEGKFDPIIVVDNITASPETTQKWESRRENEILKKKKNLPLNLDILICDAFKQHGSKIYADRTVDADDVVAKLASFSPDSLILSSDRDMFRYDLYNKNRIFSTATMSSRCDLKLWKGLNLCVKPGCSFKAVDDIPMIYPTDKPYHALDKAYIRGVSDSHSDFVNLHHVCKRIRQNLYSELSISSVTERYPIYDKKTNGVLWINEVVYPEKFTGGSFDFATLLGILGKIDPMKQPTHERLYARESIIAEYIAMITKESLTTILKCETRAKATWDNIGTFVLCKDCNQTIHIEYQLLAYIKEKHYPMPTTCGLCKSEKSLKIGKHK